MEKSTFTPLYDMFRAMLVEMRKKAGLTQRGLAERLGREHSFVAKIEQGERRVDVVEFYWICMACRLDLDDELLEVARRLRRLNRTASQKQLRDR